MGPPQASAAHARARTARQIAQLLRSPLVKATTALGLLTIISWLPTLLAHAPLPGFGLWRILFSIALFIVLVRVVHHLAAETLWLLRNRLLLAYVFVGVVPVLLIGGMLAIGAYLFYGQYASYMLVSYITERTNNLGAVNTLTLRELENHPDRSSDAAGLSSYYASYYFPRGFGSVRSYFYDATMTPETADSRKLGPPNAWLKSGFLGFIVRPEGYTLASFHVAAPPTDEKVLTLYALSPKTMDNFAQGIGQVAISETKYSCGGPATLTGGARSLASPVLASTQPLRPRSSFFDIEINGWALIPATNWETGDCRSILVNIKTRPSLLNDKLFASVPNDASDDNRWPLQLLGVAAIIFLVIELLSLVAGIRLTRTITGAVNDLYVGTEHINRGDFGHQIAVRTRDQLAALAISFNNMTASIARLLEEQREKQRLENELTIAHEVQAQLFPRTPPHVAGFEVFGRCLPARVVSGDYFDFVKLGAERVSLTLGDISGKGISAALLMATIVSALRAYQPSPGEEAEIAPNELMARLSNQLYHSTPPEKYATMFYAVYNGARRTLRYTNAGHLAPAVIGAGGTRRLEIGGTVVGMFEGTQFEQGEVQLQPGDLIAMWSDGITEPENEYGVEFGEARLLAMLEANRTQPLHDIAATVLQAVREWNGDEEQADDVTLVLGRVKS